MGKKKKLTRLEKSTNILLNAKATQWCYVDIENEFTFIGTKWRIGKDVKEYKVVNKAYEVEDYTNESYMEEVLAVVNNDNVILFYNQNYDLIEEVYSFEKA